MTRDPILIYDGNCKLCNNAVQFLKSKKSDGGFRFVPSADPSAKPLLDEHKIGKGMTDSTVILIDENRVYTKSEAIIRSIQRRGPLWKFAGILLIIPAFLRDLVYDRIARIR